MAKIICDGLGEIFSARNTFMPPQHVYLVELSRGDRVSTYSGLFYTISEPSVAIMDHAILYLDDRLVKTTNVRQIIPGSRDTIVQKGYFNNRMRQICAKRGAARLHVSDGICPIVEKGNLCIADFVAGRNGSIWYVMPEKIYHEFTRAWAREQRLAS